MEMSKLFKWRLGLRFLLLVLVGCFVLASSSATAAAAATATTTAGSKNVTSNSQKLGASEQPSMDRDGDLFGSSGALAESLDSIDLSPADANAAEASGASPSAESIEADLLPKEESLFEKDALDVGALQKMDCHLRNIDFCYAGLMGASERLLPETDRQLEVRCDEMKAAASCVAIYNQRCQTLKVFGAMSMFMAQQQQQQAAFSEMELPPVLESALLGSQNPSGQPETGAATDRIKMSDLSSLCEPDAKAHKHNKLIRRRIFQLAKCINERIPALKPCIEDLKTALQVFYEPSRSLPMKPTCCAISRFRACSMDALDNICGLASFEQLESSLASSSGAGSMMKTVERVCRIDSARGHETAYCLDVLPPSGMKATQRRGSKASKLAKALDLFSFSPAVQQ